MHKLLLSLFTASFVTCQNEIVLLPVPQPRPPAIQRIAVADKQSWAYFLQHLPEKDGAIVDYRGNAVDDQHKKYTLLDYDVGQGDLQQCADALIRLRAEYLFRQQRFTEIRFHFTNGTLYSFSDYVDGKRPIVQGNRVSFAGTRPAVYTYPHLRRYLALVYAYAGTISLANELKDADGFDIGTVVVTPGSPGHCFMITDLAIHSSGDTVYKLVEGYSPAQSMYVLRNTASPELGSWHRLQKGVIQTASYTFHAYRLKKFE